MSATHEPLIPHSESRTSSDRAFGLTVGGILLAIALIRWLPGAQGPDLLTGLLGMIGAGLGTLGLVAADRLAPLNRAWTKLGLLLSKLVSPIVMFVVYALTVVPTGLMIRALGRDPLRLRRRAEAESYWIVREPPGPAPESMKEQF